MPSSGAATTRSLRALWVVAASLAVTVASAQEPLTIRTSVNLVLLDVGVWSKDGTPAVGLKKENFEIRDNGRRRPVSTFDLGSAAISFALAIDFSRSMRPRKAAVVEAARHFVDRLAGSDEVATLVFSDGVNIVQPAALAKGLDHAWLVQLQDRHPDGKTALYDAVAKAASLLSQARHQRRVCILLSDGADTASSISREEAISNLRRANVTVFSIGLFRQGDPETDADFLEDMARESGGSVLLAHDAAKLPASFDDILAGLRARYVLGFAIGEAAAGKTELHRLKVRVRDDKGRVLRTRTRRSYQLGDIQ